MRKLCLVLAALGLVSAHPGVGQCGVALNEVMADPATDWNGSGEYSFRDDEWVEIVNTGPGTLDLGGVFVGDESGGFVYGFTGSLAEGDVRVVYGSDATAWESAHGESATGLRLGNDGDTVTLWQVTGSDTLLVDAYTYNTNEADDDRSSGRMPDGGPTWELFDLLNPFTGSTTPAGNGRAPTPGLSNLTDGGPPTPVRQVTWGAVKSLYQDGAPEDPPSSDGDRP